MEERVDGGGHITYRRQRPRMRVLSPEAILRRIARGVNGAGKRNAECVEMRKSGERERSTEKERGV